MRIVRILQAASVILLGTYLGFPYQEYFGISDYLSKSLNTTGQVLISALLSVAFVFATFSSLSAYSLRDSELIRKSASGPIHTVTYHFIGISSIPLLILSYYENRALDPVLALCAMLYPGFFVVAYLSERYFEKPIKAYLLLSCFFLSSSFTVSNVIREINSLNMPTRSSPGRIPRFVDAEYSEIDWQFIAFASDYIIMRNRETHRVLVRARSDLKVIES